MENAKGFKTGAQSSKESEVSLNYSSKHIEDSQKAFDQCVLCLSRVVDPMSCSHGHIFCKICIIENLMLQKKQHDVDIKRYNKE